MTIRQRILKRLYPLIMLGHRLAGKKPATLGQTGKRAAPVSFYSLHATLNTGEEIPFSSFRGRKVLIVNTASACGYTPQYTELEDLFKEWKDRLIILGFPANDFGQQEPGTDEEIAAFCNLHYGVSFPLVRKSSVARGRDQHPVFAWLTQSSQNGWNDRLPEWNFTKYLVNEAGELIAVFPSGISPLDEELQKALRQ